MLEKLIIKNYALIDSLQIDFAEGLSIITGETGAGKSVMLGALSLLTGERADSKVLVAREGKAMIEGWFDNVAPSLKMLFEHLDLDWNGGQVIVRREIAANGRSRAFVNDTPVTLPVLGEVTQNLVDVHSQNSNRLLASPEHQLWIIDSMADNARLLAQYRTDFRQYVNLRSRIRKIKESMERSRESRELLQFQLEQLNALELKEGELAEIERRFELLSDADELRESLYSAFSALDEGDESALELVGRARNLTAAFPDLNARLEAVYIELSDISATLEERAGDVEADPLELSRLSTRMHELYEAQRRFKVTECDALISLRDSIASQLSDEAADPGELREMESQAKALARKLREEADRLSESRRKAGEKFSARLMREARPLGLKNLRFDAVISQGKLTADGQDQVEFLCCFNKNQELMPLNKVASGGEMSRLTLTIKAMLADRLKLPTVIFDEIDTGVSGEIADKMGEMMAQIAEDMQVLAITHLPQVAAKGKTHYMVYKTDLKDRTVSNVRQLSSEERVREIARMLSGRKLNDAALQNARALLGLQ